MATKDSQSVEPTQEDTSVVGARIGAHIIDVIVMVILFYAPLLMSYFIGGIVPDIESAFVGFGVLVGIAAALGYYFFIEAYWDGYTVGKKMLDIRVVKKDGGSCSYLAAFIRNLLQFIDGIYWIPGLISIAVTDKRQRLGDLAAGTVVVREDYDEKAQAEESRREKQPTP